MSFIPFTKAGWAARSRVVVPARTNSWGYLPELTLLSGLGMLLIGLADTAARDSAGWAQLAFWIGLLVVFIPTAVRLLSVGATNRERATLVSLLGLELYLVKVLQSPIYLTYHDELLHWESANDILNTHHLFHENSLLPVSPLYPGLELATSALNSLSGLPIFYCGLIVIGLARLLFVISLYLLFSQIAGSERVGGIGVLLYMTNPNFVFFDSQFSYESIALPFAAFVLFGIAARAWIPQGGRLGVNLAVLLGLGATTVSHHLTSYALVGFLTLWMLCCFPKSKRTENRVNPAGTTLILLVMVVAWLVYVANIVVGYLAPIFSEAFTQVVRLISGEATSRQFFKDQSGEVAPLWEQLIGLGSTGILIIGLPFGLLVVWERFRKSPVALALALGGAAYPFSLGLRLTPVGVEVASRANGFLLVGTSFVLALGFVNFRPYHATGFVRWWLGWFPFQKMIGWLVALINWGGRLVGRLKLYILTLWLGGLFMGAIIVGGGPPWARLPGPYLVAADMRSIEAQSITTAYWSLKYLGPGNRIVSDRINRLLNGSYGQQYPVTNLGDNIDESPVFFSIELGNYEYDLLKRGRIQYLIVDMRLSTGLPRLGVYFEQGEPGSNTHKQPISPQALAKFDRLDGVSRIFDNGNIVIYDVRKLSGENAAAPAP